MIFRYEGLGFQLVESILKRDYALAQTLALLFTAIVIFSNFLADIAHQLVDPRVRDRGGRLMATGRARRRVAEKLPARRGASGTRSRC